MNELNNKEEYQDEFNIDIVNIAKTLWDNKLTIAICVIVSTIFGCVVAFSTPNQYTARTILVPQVKSNSKSNLSSLAALAGVDLGLTESSDLSPLIYPKIVRSVPFNLELMNLPVSFKSQKRKISIYEYYTKYKKTSVLDYIVKFTIGLPSVVLDLIKPDQKEIKISKETGNVRLYLTKKQLKVKKILDKNMQLLVEKKDGYLTLSVTAEDPIVAAELTQKAQQMLQDFITEFKIEKSRAELQFIQGRYDVAKSEAERFQINMASNLDKYKNLTSNIPMVGNSRIQTKYSIANSVYMELAKQLEQAKIQVKRDTPVFTIIEPVVIPTYYSKPNRPIILFLWLFIGFTFGIGLVYLKKWYLDSKMKWKELSLSNMEL